MCNTNLLIYFHVMVIVIYFNPKQSVFENSAYFSIIHILFHFDCIFPNTRRRNRESNFNGVPT